MPGRLVLRVVIVRQHLRHPLRLRQRRCGRISVTYFTRTPMALRHSAPYIKKAWEKILEIPEKTGFGKILKEREIRWTERGKILYLILSFFLLYLIYFILPSFLL